MIEYENLNKVNAPYSAEFKKAFEAVLDSGWFILGNNVTEFEKEFSEYLGAGFCAGVASGLDALSLSLKILGLPEKSEVIVPSNTYIATILSILQNGHIPVFVEPDIRTYNINPELIEHAITSKTKAVMIVHLYGKPCDMDPITDVCRKHGLYLIEDCAQSHGAKYKGRHTGTFGDMAAFSFYPTKNLGCLGDGGALVSNNPDYIKKAKMLRNYGSEKKYYNEVAGMNSRLDELQAAFLRVKLRHLDEIVRHKNLLAAMYTKGLNCKYILPYSDDNLYNSFHIFNIRHEKRDRLKDFLLAEGIKTEVHYPVAPHKQKALGYMNNLSFPLSEEIHRTTLSLPVSSFHTKEEIQTVIDVLNRFED